MCIHHIYNNTVAYRQKNTGKQVKLSNYLTLLRVYTFASNLHVYYYKVTALINEIYKATRT